MTTFDSTPPAVPEATTSLGQGDGASAVLPAKKGKRKRKITLLLILLLIFAGQYVLMLLLLAAAGQSNTGPLAEIRLAVAPCRPDP